MTDWHQWYACDVCHALIGQECYDLSSGGPQALPPRYRDIPHSARKPRTAGTPATRATAPESRPKPATRVGQPARRRAARTESTAAAWRALAARRRRT